MVILMVVAGALYFSYVFSYLYLWTVAPQVWPATDTLPTRASVSALLLLGSSALLLVAGRALDRRARFTLLLTAATGALLLSLGVEIHSQWQSGLRPPASSHAALVYTNAVLQSQLVAALVVMASMIAAWSLTGRLNGTRRVGFDNLSLLWHYTVAQSLFGLLLVHGFPRTIP
jgi:cytochrome c oxidase subunit I+III